MIRPFRRDATDEHGLTVIELVIATALLMIVVGAALNMLDSGTRTERAQQARHSALLDLRESMTRMTKDIRQATRIHAGSTGGLIKMTTLIAGEEQVIGYGVVDSQLVRILYPDEDALGTPTEVLLADHLTSLEPFCYYDAEAVVEGVSDGCVGSPPSTLGIVRISLALEPEVFSGGPITLATDVHLRNPQTIGS